MKTNVTLSLLAFIAIVFFQSCAGPQSIIKLKPTEEGEKWLYGQNFVSDSLYGIIYEVAFDQYQDNEYWFDFNIVNRSNMSILIDPVNFRCQALNDSLHALTVKRKAVDPEEEIFAMEEDLSRNEAMQKNRLGISLMALGIDIATAAATATDDNPNNDHFRTHMFEEVDDMMLESKFEAQSISELLGVWKSSTIRKTTLEPSYSMQGKVFFPANPDATYIKLFLPVDDEFIEFSFKQVEHPVY